MSSLLSYYWVIEFVAAIAVMAVGLNEQMMEPFNTNKKMYIPVFHRCKSILIYHILKCPYSELLC